MQKANKVCEIVGATDAVATRGIDNIPDDLVYTEGAKEAAILTLTARCHDFEFKPVMQALERLAAVKDWSHPFMIADKRSLNWRDAPLREYESFANFYARELEETWGKWENLQRTWDQIVKGEISEDEGRRIVLRGHGGDRRSEKAKADQSDNDENDVTLKDRGNSRAYVLARLDRDRPDLAAEVRAKTMSANAAAIEAGFHKKVVREKLTTLQRAERAVAKLTADEWQDLRRREDRRRQPSRPTTSAIQLPLV
jgi:hypothetical protein